MTRTEQAIQEFETTAEPTCLIDECRRLSRLCGAYWDEIEAFRKWFDAEQTIEVGEPLAYQDAVNARAATDAARREVGKGTT